MNYDRMIQPEEAAVGRPPKEDTEVIGLRLPVSLVKALDKALAKHMRSSAATGIRSRTALIRRYIAEGLERDNEPR